MNSSDIREKFLKFFESRGHKVVPSSSLVPEGDASVLFTTAGLQQFKPYYIGAKDPVADFGMKNTVSVQKSVRTSDIEEVGDERHLTFFEMLGNFSFGGYWKKEAIEYAHEFVTKIMNLKIDYVTVFEGEDNVPEDMESAEIWRSIDPSIVIKKFGRGDNFWGPTGEEGPCGPTTEIYVNGIEIWNIVFNEFYSDKAKKLTKLEKPGVDTGMGLERLTMVSQNVPTVFDTDLFTPILPVAESRMVADHVRSAVFMIADGVRPSNTERGYILRRLIRRAYFANKNLVPVIDAVIAKYSGVYSFSSDTHQVIKEEAEKFEKTLESGLKQLDKESDPFKLFATYGLPFDVIKEKFPSLTHEEFEARFKEHQDISRAGMEQKFKGGLAGHSEAEVKYHTATHLLHQALHDVLGSDVGQKGSNITTERLRFDFSFPRKLTEEEKIRVEEIVNEKITQALPVRHSVLHKEEALKSGARHSFDEKYPSEVSVYYIGSDLDNAYSKEFCGGPHVENTRVLGKFKITKEEAVSAGVRRIKATLE
ncbi:alanine--tRNA ligase [Candidatus Parcubacteria bacterium]|nr:alanine--tRNA ligase [Candidatus Parcubacteria bacterium]